MKRKIMLAACTLFLAVFFIGTASGTASAENVEARKSYYLPAKTEELEGTWIIKSDLFTKTEQKFVYYWWGYFETYRFANDKKPWARGTSTIVDKWIDDEGAIWYKEFCRMDWGSRTIIFRLIKLSDNARKWESVQSTIDFPSQQDLTAKDHGGKEYRVFYRHELEACCH